MMKNFGHVLEREKVDFILIGGQASILYGAATFSEDIDLWVDPNPSNWRNFLHVLHQVNARVHKLTPPLQPSFARKGHGFHFVIPVEGDLPIYLDVIGRPPRVGSFRSCRARSQMMDFGWGNIPVISLEDLVLLKQTRRRSDYEVISRLVRLKVEEETRDKEPSESLLRWALCSTFSVEDILWLIKQWPESARMIASLSRPVLRILRLELSKKKLLSERTLRSLADALETEIRRRQQADTKYWAPIIAELRALRRNGKLLMEGMLL